MLRIKEILNICSCQFRLLADSQHFCSPFKILPYLIMLVLFCFGFLLVSQLRFDKRKTYQPTDNVSHTLMYQFQIVPMDQRFCPSNFDYNFIFTFTLIWSNKTSSYKSSFLQYLPLFLPVRLSR